MRWSRFPTPPRKVFARICGTPFRVHQSGGGPDADFDIVLDKPSNLAARIANGPVYFLSVGTLEPRKAYPLAIDAFEQLWAAGQEVRYVIVGRPGWNTQALQRRLRQHSEYGRRLLWLDDAEDADLGGSTNTRAAR